MIISDLTLNGGLTYGGEWDLGFDYVDSQVTGNGSGKASLPWFPTGRLHCAPQFFRFEIKHVTPLPENLPDVGYLERDPLQPFVPTAILADWKATTLPSFAYNRAHWTGPNISDVPNSLYYNTRWHLVYASSFDNTNGVQITGSVDQGELDRTVNVFVDSQGIASSGDPSLFVGWILMLVQQQFSVVDSQEPPIVGYVVQYALSLFQPELPLDAPLDFKPPPRVVFNPFQVSTWIPFIDQLRFPDLTFYLYPWQP